MSGREMLHSIAKKDTPEIVNIPDTWPGIAAWLIARLGVGVIGFGLLYIVYQDFMETHKDFYRDIKTRDERVVRALEKAIESQYEFTSVVRGFDKNQKETLNSLDNHTRLLESLERNNKN